MTFSFIFEHIDKCLFCSLFLLQQLLKKTVNAYGDYVI